MPQEPGSVAPERCPSCGATVFEGAEWCGLCFSPLRPQEPERAPPVRSQERVPPEGPPGPPEARSTAAVWPCPVCGNRNAIELEACATCGTPFGSLFDERRERRRSDPASAFRWSLLYPGLGHAKAGHGLDGVARGVLFTMLLGMAALILLSGATSGPLFGVLALFGGTAAAVYFFAAAEAYRLAEGGRPLVPSKVLLWGTVAILLVSVMMLALVIGSASNR